ncbi:MULTISPECIES: hypothetical protein [Streptomyces]|uniref:hypothetical protein n=1 Tax=Streptomyces TaxID=1883 RepID=UPI00142EFF72|nr:hypothetical protein [Streptomyces tendae]
MTATAAPRTPIAVRRDGTTAPRTLTEVPRVGTTAARTLTPRTDTPRIDPYRTEEPRP